MMKISLYFLTLAILSDFCLAVNFYRKFSYERGHCEKIDLNNVVDDTIRSELIALLNPQIRYSNKKILHYDLYTRQNPEKRQVLSPYDVTTLSNSNFNPQWPVRFSIHGWRGKSMTCSNAAIKDAYMSRGDFNVIIVDWSAHSLDVSYRRISRQLRDIAAELVTFIKFLHKQTGVAYEQISLIGHSAGSHIAGLAGKILKPLRIGNIIALDPAGLTQLHLGPEHRLAPDDALYVESLHTDVTLLGNPYTDLSQASFFPNWGQGQPHCPNVTAAEIEFSCDHFSAIYYFAESIRNPKLFGALRCHNNNNNNSNSNNNNINNNINNLYSNTNTKNNNIVGNYKSKNFKCSCEAKKKSCDADVYFGGEPVIPKQGVFYFSTQNKPPYGLGAIVQMRARKKQNPLRSRIMGTITQTYFRP